MPVGPDGQTNENYVVKRNRFIFVRPGACDFIKRLQAHPRCAFGFHSSMRLMNVEDIAQVFADLDPEIELSAL